MIGMTTSIRRDQTCQANALHHQTQRTISNHEKERDVVLSSKVTPSHEPLYRNKEMRLYAVDCCGTDIALLYGTDFSV